MTIDEAFKQGIYRLRRSAWGPHEYLEIQPVREGKFYGPWATLHSILNSAKVPADVRTERVTVPLWEVEQGDWLPYEEKDV